MTQFAIRDGDIVRNNGEIEKYVLKKKYNGLDLSIECYNTKDLTTITATFPSEEEARKFSDLGKDITNVEMQ